jgi:hypothetical protein
LRRGSEDVAGRYGRPAWTRVSILVCMDDAEGPVWFANDDDSGYVWRSGGMAIVPFSLPCLLGMCVLAGHSGPAPGAAWLIAVTALPMIVVAARTVVGYVFDRRMIVRMRLHTVPGRPAVVDMTRANGRSVRYPLASVNRIDIVREMALASSVAHHSTMVFLVAGRVERTRPGPGDLPQRWVDAFTRANVETVVYNHHQSDPKVRIRYRRVRALPLVDAAEPRRVQRSAGT